MNNTIKNGTVDNLELQKNLLATGLLKDRLQQSVDMIVAYGGFNDVVIRRELDLKYPSIMKKPNPIDKAKLDLQNPKLVFLLLRFKKTKQMRRQL